MLDTTMLRVRPARTTTAFRRRHHFNRNLSNFRNRMSTFAK